jgi:hypothetical protein
MSKKSAFSKAMTNEQREQCRKRIDDFTKTLVDEGFRHRDIAEAALQVAEEQSRKESGAFHISFLKRMAGDGRFSLDVMLGQRFGHYYDGLDEEKIEEGSH